MAPTPNPGDGADGSDESAETQIRDLPSAEWVTTGEIRAIPGDPIEPEVTQISAAPEALSLSAVEEVDGSTESLEAPLPPPSDAEQTVHSSSPLPAPGPAPTLGPPGWSEFEAVSPFQNAAGSSTQDPVRLPVSRTPLKVLAAAAALVFGLGATVLAVNAHRTTPTAEPMQTAALPTPIEAPRATVLAPSAVPVSVPQPTPEPTAETASVEPPSQPNAPAAIVPAPVAAQNEAPTTTREPTRPEPTPVRASSHRAEPRTAAQVQQLIAGGDRLRARHRLRLAETEYQKALRLDGDNTRALRALTEVQLERRRGRDAVQTARKLVAAAPRTASSHTLLARALEAVGQRREARQELREAQELSPHAGSRRSDAPARTKRSRNRTTP